MNIQLYQFTMLDEFVDLKGNLKKLWDIYSVSTMRNKSFDRINSLYLSIDTYFWAIDRKVPEDLNEFDLNFWMLNNYICRYILLNVNIDKLKLIVYLKKFNQDTRNNIDTLIENIILNFKDLSQKYPLNEINFNEKTRKIVENSIPTWWRK